MTKRHNAVWEDPFDSPDEPDEFDGFIIESVDETEELGYGGDNPFCEFQVGDSDGLCIRDRYGCHYQGCDRAEDN